MKILLVEDEQRLALYMKRALEEAGYAVEHVADGEEALQFILDFHGELDAILLDIFLPHLSGKEICRQVRKQSITTPILMVTAKDQEKEKIDGLDLGADDYITKPFSLPELLARLRSSIRRARGEIGKQIVIQDIMINPTERKVFLKGQEIKLTLKEYNLLHLLAIHANQVLDREYILEQLWDRNVSTYSNVIDVQIKNLRKKIHDNNQQIISVVRGIGFRLNNK